MREVVIFRHNLFKVSEPFITAQGQALTRYRPLYVGRLRYGPPPKGSTCIVLHAPGEWATMLRVGWQMISRSPRTYERLLTNHRPALIHAHFGIEGVYALPLAERLGIPLVTTFHGFDATLAAPAFFCSPAWMEYPLFRRALAARGTLFLCVSAFIRDRVLAMGFPAARTHVHYIGVDCAAIRPREQSEEAPVILHVARLVPVKGTRYLIEAFGMIAATHPEVRLVIVGDGALRRSLAKLAASLGLAARIAFLGALAHAEVLAWMRRALVFALPSVRTKTGREEGLGMALLEAAATGVPAVASRLGGIPEAVVDGETGLLAAPRDAAGLARHLAALLDSPERRRQMGMNARALVEQRFALARQMARLESFYDRVRARER